MISLRALLLAYLLNALWQVPLFFAGASLAAFALRGGTPRTLHRLWVAALLLECLFPALCLRSWPWLNTLARVAASREGTHTPSIFFTFGPATTLGESLASPLGTALLLAYGLCTVYFALRLLWGVYRTATLQQSAVVLQTSPAISTAWTRACLDFNIRGALLAESPRVRAPLTLGLRRKYVLLPPGLLASLEDPERGAVLAHECAHMQRNDFARNLLYEFLTLPVAFHPFLRATRTRMVESREWVCDGMAAEALAAPQTYARSLLRLATLLLHASSAPTSHAIGIFTHRALERRLMYLTRKSSPLSPVRRLAALAACTLAAAVTCASAWALRSSPLSPAPQTAPATPGTVRIASGVMAGQVEGRVNPVYPPEAKAAGVEGSVVLHAIISKEGTIESLKIVSGPEELTASAIDAVRQWTYKPYLLNGEPVAVETTITVNYQLNN